MKKNQPFVSLVVINYNGLVHLKEYFDSVYAQTRMPDEVIMMDNASADESVKFVTKHYPKVQIIKNPFNAGTALGSNIAFDYCKGDLVIFQSNDIKLDKNCVAGLVEAMSDQSVGIATSILLQYFRYKKDKQMIIDNAGGVSDVYGLGMQKYPEGRYQDLKSQEEVFFSYGGSFIIRRELFERTNGYDQRYFTLNDDIDLSWRVRLLGKKIIYVKKSFIYHKVSATLGILFVRSIKRYWSERNVMRTLIKNHTLRDLLIYFPQYLLLLLAEMGYFLYRKRPDLFLADLKAILWNLLYLPETLWMRLKIQRGVVNRNLSQIMSKKSYKLMLFSSMKHTI